MRLSGGIAALAVAVGLSIASCGSVEQICSHTDMGVTSNLTHEEIVLTHCTTTPPSPPPNPRDLKP
jgi:hypothetical protein